MTRIVAGDAGGRRLVVPKGRSTRPTSERVREALFSGLEVRGLVAGARVLDLYSGSGALGLEAASRGAASAVLVDSAHGAVEAARRNVRELGLSGVTVVLSSVRRFLAGGAALPVGLVFADPPYAMDQAELTAMLSDLVAGGWLEPSSTVVIERSAQSIEPGWPRGLVRVALRRYGDTALWYAHRRPEQR